MSDKNNSDQSAGTKPRRTLTLKTTEQGTVRQSFSHGRTKAVVVEKRKRRIVGPGSEDKAQTDATPPKVEVKAPVVEQKSKRSGLSKAKIVSADGDNQRILTDSEQEARMAALREAQIRDAEERERAEEEAKKRAEEAARREKEATKQAAEEAKRQSEESEPEEQAEEIVAPVVPPSEKPSRRDNEIRKIELKSDKPVKRKEKDASPAEDDEEAPSKASKRMKAPTPPKPTPRTTERRRGKLTITSVTEDGEETGGRSRSLAAMRRRQEKAKRAQQQQTGPREKIKREVRLPETITIQELANRMSERAVDVIKLLMQQGQMLKINDIIDADTAELIAEEMGHTVRRVSEADVEEGLFAPEDDDGDLQPRAPVVTIMGHVDHGKTSLLDALRESNVVSGEAGGITQHIGAYQVEKDGHHITFIDTPGHEAFTSMRARGAKATDLVILVVAADDSVMPTTIEAINHTKAANVPIIVAINKIDKPEANPEKVKTDLLQHEVVVEAMGGDVMTVEVSAKNRINLDGLLEAIILQSEVMELKANPDRLAEGIVVEAQLDKGRGPVATVLVQRGTLKQGDILVAGAEWARVRALVNDRGEQVAEAGPSAPVEVLGFQGTPSAGDRFSVVENEARAREVTSYRQRQIRDKLAARTGGARGSLEQMMNRLQTEDQKEFPVLVKGDVQGSVEALMGALEKVGNEEITARIIHGAPGGVTESDVALAAASEAPIIAFNVRANAQAREAAEREGIEIRYYNVIYDIIDDIKAAMSGMLSPEKRETFIGNAEILEVFNISKVGKVAGCRVTEGKVERGAGVRLIRDNVVIHEGELGTLKRFKDDVKEVVGGQECGMNFTNYQDMRPGDIIECYRVEEIARSL
jgi:translation initiation factor IF-2